MDSNHDHHVTRTDLADYVKSHAELWAMLGVNLGIEEQKCEDIATRVAFELACGKQGRESFRVSSITGRQWNEFRKKYINDPKGTQEFFHRTVFATFDENYSSSLDEAQLDHFLDTFYTAGSIFKGDARLPEKEKLRALVYEKLDVDHDGNLSFEELRSLISGSAARGDLLS